jgi:hypothetical protein
MLYIEASYQDHIQRGRSPERRTRPLGTRETQLENFQARRKRQNMPGTILD